MEPRLWPLYQALPHEQKTIMRLKALIEPAVSKSAFFEIVRLSGLNRPGGKAYTQIMLNEHMRSLQKKRLLNDTLACAPELLHAIAVDADECTDGAALLKAAKTSLPRSPRDIQHNGYLYYYKPPLNQDFDLFRRLRLAVYANDEAEFIRLRGLIEAETPLDRQSPLLAEYLAKSPVDRSWLERRQPVIREVLVESYIGRLVEAGDVRDGANAIAEQWAQMAPGLAGARIARLLLRLDILSANFTQARQRMALLPAEDAHFVTGHEAAIAFLTGNNKEAVAGFREALKQFRKFAGKRKVVLEAETGLLHALALLRANDPALHAELGNLIDIAKTDYSPFFAAYSAVAALLDLAAGREGPAREIVKELSRGAALPPLSTAIVALAELFVDIGISREHARENEAECTRLAGHMPLPARVIAEILSKTEKDGARWRERAAEMGGETIIAFTEILSFKPPWERAFDSLAAFLKPEEPKRGGNQAPAKTKRLAWYVDLNSGEVEAVEQSVKGKGWTGGRPIALKRLRERDARLDYLTEDDKRVLRCIRKEAASWYNENSYFFDEYRTLPALAGHPNVFDARNRGTRIELVAYPVELVVKERRAATRSTCPTKPALPQSSWSRKRPRAGG